MTTTTAKGREEWVPLLPVPEGTPPARFTHHKRGEVKRVFTYRDDEGRLLGYVCRFDRQTGGTVDLTLTFTHNTTTGERMWRWIQFRAKRPIYGWERIVAAEQYTLHVLVHDEWAAEEIAQIPEFQHMLPIAWPGGRSKIGEVDWAPLRGKMVVVWMPHSAERFKVDGEDPQRGALLPIEKQPWRVTARKLQETLREHGALPLGIIEAEKSEDLADGWDALVALNAGWTGAQLWEWYEKRLGATPAAKEANALSTPSTPTAAFGREGWMESLLRKDGTGPLLAELHHVRQILSNHSAWKDVIWLDAFSQRVMKSRPPPFEGSEPGEWTDVDDSMTADWLAHKCQILRLKSSLVAEGVHMVASLNRRNPLVDYLEGLKHDGVPRLDTWLSDYLGAGRADEDESAAEIERRNAYLRLVGRNWMLGAVARALVPGIKFDHVLILEGQQGLGKSSALSILGGEWAMDTPFSLTDKEGMENIRGKWIVEIAELDSFNKAENTTAKTFFSRASDRFRLPYGKRSADFKRACVFGGTTNEHEYFRDPTGNRRYLPVYCHREGFDQAKLAKDRDQLFAEAVKLFRNNERLYFNEAERAIVEPEQERRTVLDGWAGIIAAWLEAPERAGEKPQYTTSRLLTGCLGIERGRIDERAMVTRVGRIMRKLGYFRVEDKKLPERYYYTKKGQSTDEGPL
jgi:predicted P-loop ATPase